MKAQAIQAKLGGRRLKWTQADPAQRLSAIICDILERRAYLYRTTFRPDLSALARSFAYCPTVVGSPAAARPRPFLSMKLQELADQRVAREPSKTAPDAAFCSSFDYLFSKS